MAEQGGTSQPGRGQDAASMVGDVSQAVVSLRDLALALFKDAPGWVRLLGYVASAASAVLLVLASVFLRFDKWLAFWVALSGFALLALIVVCATVIVVSYVRAKGSLGKGVPHARRPPKWSRVVPKRPIPDDSLDELAKRLEDIRNAGFAWLSGRRPALGMKPSEVRSNVFFPDYTTYESGEAFVLRMDDRVRAGMEGHPDAALEFHPHQGVTGRVFADGKMLAAQAVEGGSGPPQFDEQYELTEEQQGRLHPGLRWIASFPLCVPNDGSRKAAGVLNIDGLNYCVSKQDLEDLMAHLLPRVIEFADQVARLPRVRLGIDLEELNA